MAQQRFPSETTYVSTEDSDDRDDRTHATADEPLLPGNPKYHEDLDDDDEEKDRDQDDCEIMVKESDGVAGL
jgi:hypothetical protein